MISETRKNTINVKGRYRVVVYDSEKVKDYESAIFWRDQPIFSSARKLYVKSETQKDNIITDFGMQLFIDLIIGASVEYPAYTQPGSGTNTPANSDTDLQTAIGSRVALAYMHRWGGGFQIDTFYNKNDNNGTWAEFGVYTQSTGSNMISRVLFTTPATKTSSDTATVTWSCDLANA